MRKTTKKESDHLTSTSGSDARTDIAILPGLSSAKVDREDGGYEAVKIYCERYIGQTDYLSHLGCAIELEHRERPVTTPAELRKAAFKITRAGYDLTAAAALAIDVRRERAELKVEMDARFAAEEAAGPRRHADAQPDGICILRELEAKQLPDHATLKATAFSRP